MEQMPLDLDVGSETQLAPTLESLSLGELLQMYKEKVGIPARTEDKDALLQAINEPENELARLRQIDSEEDKRELAAPYKR